MIFKVLYLENIKSTLRRENTKSMYLKADSEVQARVLVQNNTDHDIEYIEPLEGNHLKYEEKNPDFKLTEFN